MTYIDIYMSFCISFRKKKNNVTKIRLHLQEIIFIEIKYNKVTISNYKINCS